MGRDSRHMGLNSGNMGTDSVTVSHHGSSAMKRQASDAQLLDVQPPVKVARTDAEPHTAHLHGSELHHSRQKQELEHVSNEKRALGASGDMSLLKADSDADTGIHEVDKVKVDTDGVCLPELQHPTAPLLSCLAQLPSASAGTSVPLQKYDSPGAATIVPNAQAAVPLGPQAAPTVATQAAAAASTLASPATTEHKPVCAAVTVIQPQCKSAKAEGPACMQCKFHTPDMAALLATRKQELLANVQQH